VRLVFLLALSLLLATPGRAQDTDTTITGQRVPCMSGEAAGFPCNNVDLLSVLAIDRMGDNTALINDIWGWTDPQDGTEYALVGRTDGLSFVDVSDPTSPVFLGFLPTATRPASWRDVKVYENHAYVVADDAGNHGMQVFDLTQLRDVSDPPVTFEATARYTRFGSTHNLAINTESGYAYATGVSGGQDPPESYNGEGIRRCGPGLHMMDLENPEDPQFAGCFTANTPFVIARGYTHDAQCVTYNGPDADYQGREICIGANEQAVSIVDVTDKDDPVPIASPTYPKARYTHQGWLGPNQRYYYQNDERDENRDAVSNTRTLVWDFQDLDEPELVNQFFHETTSIDHNLYVRDSLLVEANYTSGLRLLSIDNPAEPQPVGFFDTTPENDRTEYEGAWSNYPYFESGIVVVSSIGEGLFVLRPTGGARFADTARTPERQSTSFALSVAPNPFAERARVTLTVPETQPVRVVVYDALGRRVATLHDGGSLPAGEETFTLEAAGLPAGTYFVRAASAGAVRTQPVTLVR